ncbi:MAG: 1-deoxy-D-xylulose-5-phosphate reductoisomerase [candidate division Zixibacteria bacterium HGW-Zixibacteria-1]|nr:MAG: 1-deoxy-D-xylulose-5-phosphate reductoisomerase [candidate division Zixibacteria bacterium HGW-Zixibacteria-1]
MKKRLVILGSSGSIGKSALDVVEKNIDRIEVVGLSVHSNIDLLRDQIARFKPKYVAVTDPDAYRQFRNSSQADDIRLFKAETGVEELAGLEEADIVLNAVVGAAGLTASLKTVLAGKRLALANKESMVIGGPLINEAAARTGAEIIPVDSEHSAIWQALFAGQKREIKKIILTGSGGPFRDVPLSEFDKITREQALSHPTWKMGPKITIDSATMMNKGLEILEAMHLFQVPIDKIDVVIHPQSVIHSMVEFIDSSIIAQLSSPDMRLPIAYALFFPERVAGNNGYIDLTEVGKLNFYKPDYEKFILLKLAFKVARSGGTTAAVYNAANEVAVAAFLKETIEFRAIPDIIINTVEKHKPAEKPNLEDIFEADRWARKVALEIMR